MSVTCDPLESLLPGEIAPRGEILRGWTCDRWHCCLPLCVGTCQQTSVSMASRNAGVSSFLHLPRSVSLMNHFSAGCLWTVRACLHVRVTFPPNLCILGNSHTPTSTLLSHLHAEHFQIASCPLLSPYLRDHPAAILGAFWCHCECAPDRGQETHREGF